MPLVKYTDEQRTEKCKGQPVPFRQSAGYANCPGEQGKNKAVSQLIPWGGYQIYSNRLRSSDEQTAHDPDREQHGCGAEGAG